MEKPSINVKVFIFHVNNLYKKQIDRCAYCRDNMYDSNDNEVVQSNDDKYAAIFMAELFKID